MRHLRKHQSVEVDAKLRALLYADIEGFVFSGGVYSLADWDELDEEEKAIAIECRKRYDAKNASMIAMACRDSDGFLAIWSEFDFGVQKNLSVMESAADLAVANMGKRPPEDWKP